MSFQRFSQKELNEVLFEKNYYVILQVRKDSTHNEIKKSFFRLAKLYHPDSNNFLEKKYANQAFTNINQAFSCLRHQRKREFYDKFDIDLNRIHLTEKKQNEMMRNCFGRKRRIGKHRNKKRRRKKKPKFEVTKLNHFIKNIFFQLIILCTIPFRFLLTESKKIFKRIHTYFKKKTKSDSETDLIKKSTEVLMIASICIFVYFLVLK